MPEEMAAIEEYLKIALGMSVGWPFDGDSGCLSGICRLTMGRAEVRISAPIRADRPSFR